MPSEPSEPSEPPEPTGWSRPRRTHPLSPWLGLPSLWRDLVPLVLGGLALGWLALIPVAAAALVGWRVLSWSRRTWSYDGSHLVVHAGVLRRTRRRVPVGRVQQVGLTEPLLHRALGLTVVRVETAGSAGLAEVALDALPRDDARALRAALVGARRAAGASGAAEAPPGPPGPAGPPGLGPDAPWLADRPGGPPPGGVVVRCSTGRLALAGVTGASLLVAAGLLFALVDLLGQLPRSVADELGDRTGDVLAAVGAVVAVGVVVAVVLGLAAAASVVAHHDLTVSLDGDDLHLRRGLLERRETIVPRHRVQSVVIAQNPAHRLLGLAAVRIRSAGAGGLDDERLLVPLATPAETAALVDAAVGRPVDVDDLLPAPPAARTRRLVRRLVPLAVAVAVLALAGVDPPVVVGVAVVGGALGVASGLDAHRALGVRWDDDVLVARRGSVWRRTSVAVRSKVQSARARSSPFQRRRDLATAHADLAGAWTTTVAVDQPADRCAALVGELTGSADPAVVR